MPNSVPESEAVRVRVSSGNPLVDSVQEITLRAALNRAIDLLADCFDSCNRPAKPGSLFSQQSEACDEQYTAVGNHKTTLIYTNNFAKSLVHSALDHLKAATSAALDTGSTVRWSSLALTRSLIEASVECLWLVEPTLDVDTRLRRTNQMLVRAGHEMARMLPDPEDSTPRLVSIDPKARAVSLEVRDAALEWAKVQGWTCQGGRAITRSRWVAEIPGRRELVALAAEGAPTFGQDVYSMLSGATHSQPLLMALAISEDAETLFERALKFLDIGLSFYTQALHAYAELMGWSDHDIDGWFAPVHATLQHLQDPEDTSLPAPRIEAGTCEMCPDYEAPYMHRLALVSHIAALLERNVERKHPEAGEAPERYHLATEFLGRLDSLLAGGKPKTSTDQDLRVHAGTGHTSGLTLLGFDPGELLTSIAASWAVLRAPTYESNAGNVQGWMFRPDEHGPAVPHGNR